MWSGMIVYSFAGAGSPRDGPPRIRGRPHPWIVVLLGGLQVSPERMRHNVELSGGLIMAEAVMRPSSTEPPSARPSSA